MDYCPRSAENGGGPNSPFKAPMNGEMEWEAGHCSYCGSLHPDVFIARLQAGDVILEPTDKSYKVYVVNSGGEPFTQSYREPASRTLVERPVERTKFYFQHLSLEQRDEFIRLYNARKIMMAYPGHFYTVPYFCRPASHAGRVGDGLGD